MSPKQSRGRSFGRADHGVWWAVSELPDSEIVNGRIRTGRFAVEMLPFGGAAGADDYAIRFRGAEVKVLANTAVGTIAGLLELGRCLRAGRTGDVTKHLRFRTRNYKHEVKLQAGVPRSVVNYTDRLWDTLCREIVRRQFNGIVFYPGYHPFEHVLDYRGFPEAASRPAAEREAVRKALNRGLAVAHSYGLTTFMQHYIGHFTEPLAKNLRISTHGRLSDIEHPEIDRYCRWCYREIFKQCPDLDGLYFNYESASNAFNHVLNTAIYEFNRMKRKPIAMHRLWNATDPEGIRSLIKSYKGRSLVCHKVMDTNDTYYLPVADSRATEWKRLIPGLEFMFEAGPCHNCGTNLCDQLWGDYDFFQTLLADAQKKGADSISFHTVNEFFSPDADRDSVFSDHEKNMARFNCLHLDAAVDYVNGRTKTRSERAARLAGRVGVTPKAGMHLLDAIEASSRLILLSNQQFCSGSAMDGYLNPGRWSQIQEPRYYYPANQLNNQASRPMWSPRFTYCPWLKKTLDTKVAPDDQYQYIIDYVDPSKSKAKLHPEKMAELLRKNVAKSFASLAKYRKAAGAAEASRLEPYIRQNALVGEYVSHEITAGIRLYSAYFAKSRPALVSALRKGLSELKTLVAILGKHENGARFLGRVTCTGDFKPEREVAAVEEALRLVESIDFPVSACRDFLDSHRHYNDIRAVVRPLRLHDAVTLGYAAKQLRKAIASAKKSLAGLARPSTRPLAANVRAWLDYLEAELAGMRPPAVSCPSRPAGTFNWLRHDDCFRAGESFVEDFAGFFKPIDYMRRVDQSFEVWHTARELVVSFRERGVDVEQRKAQWEKFRGSGSDSFVTRIFVDTEGKGRDHSMFMVFPMGESVNKDSTPNVGAKTDFSWDDTTWKVTVWLPWSLLGRRPRKGETWRLNVTSNPAVARNCAYTWAPQYDCGGNAAMFGKLRFE